MNNYSEWCKILTEANQWCSLVRRCEETAGECFPEQCGLWRLVDLLSPPTEWETCIVKRQASFNGYLELFKRNYGIQLLCDSWVDRLGDLMSVWSTGDRCGWKVEANLAWNQLGFLAYCSNDVDHHFAPKQKNFFFFFAKSSYIYFHECKTNHKCMRH